MGFESFDQPDIKDGETGRMPIRQSMSEAGLRRNIATDACKEAVDNRFLSELRSGEIRAGAVDEECDRPERNRRASL